MSQSILIVDDEPLIRAYARDILEEKGYSAAEAKNAADALHILGKEAVDVVLTDIQLGAGPDGLELGQTIKAKWPGIAVIVMSGRVLPNPAELPAGAVFVSKPFSDHRLLSALAAVRPAG